jgi:hypothetical protein
MKKLLFSAAVAALFFTACKKKNDDSNAGSFSVNGKSYAVNYGYDGTYIEDGVSDGDVAFVSHSFTETDNDKFSGTYSYVDLGIDSLIDGATYTFLPSYQDGYNKAKNFGWADIAAGMKVVNGEYVESDGEVSLGSPTSGTVTVKKSGSRYTFTFELVYSTSTTVKGQYTGTLEKY